MLSEMHRLVSSGELRPDDLVWRIGTVDWVRAGSVPALCRVPPPVAPPPALPAKTARPSKLQGVLAALTFYGCGIVLGRDRIRPRSGARRARGTASDDRGVAYVVALRHQMWKAIDDGQTSIRPGAAAGLMLVPLFNLYWVFRVFPGLAGELAAYARRHGSAGGSLGRGILITYAVLFVIGMIPVVGVLAFVAQLVVAPIAVVSICNAIDALHASGPAAFAASAQPARA
jgi:hypothetical protein